MCFNDRDLLMSDLRNKSQFTKFRRILHDAERELDSIYMTETQYNQLYMRLFTLVNECLNLTTGI